MLTSCPSLVRILPSFPGLFVYLYQGRKFEWLNNYVWLKKISVFYTVFNFFFFFFFFFFRKRAREEEREGEGEEHQCVKHLMRPLLGTWPATQACALTGNQTGSWHSIHWATPARATLSFEISSKILLYLLIGTKFWNWGLSLRDFLDM